jgi:hypothetical protein
VGPSTGGCALSSSADLLGDLLMLAVASMAVGRSQPGNQLGVKQTDDEAAPLPAMRFILPTLSGECSCRCRPAVMLTNQQDSRAPEHPVVT